MPELVWSVPSVKSTVFLTFDDGPQPEATPYVLDTLAEYEAKATFFVVGANVERYPDLYERIRDEGHRVGNHSYTHLKGWSTTTKDYVRDVERCDKMVGSCLFRPPYGRISLGQIKALKNRYKIIMWNKLGKDYLPKNSPENVIKNCTYNLKGGDIIVLHDSPKTIELLKNSLPKILETIKNRGLNLGKL